MAHAEILPAPVMVILMYHAFARPGERPSRYVVARRRFANQMSLLKSLRYRVLNLEEYLRCRRDDGAPPRHSVVITIDDGFADNYTVAYPVLKRHRYPATIFLVTGKVGGRSDWTSERSLAGRELLSWEHVREMQRGGIAFGAHTRTHPRLSALTEDAAHTEIIGSQMDVARATGKPVRTFAYPYGDSTAASHRIAATAGFWGSCGTESGKNSRQTPLHNLRRTEICGTDSLMAFAVKLWTGKRDWPHDR